MLLSYPKSNQEDIALLMKSYAQAVRLREDEKDKITARNTIRIYEVLTINCYNGLQPIDDRSRSDV